MIISSLIKRIRDDTRIKNNFINHLSNTYDKQTIKKTIKGIEIIGGENHCPEL